MISLDFAVLQKLPVSQLSLSESIWLQMLVQDKFQLFPEHFSNLSDSFEILSWLILNSFDLGLSMDFIQAYLWISASLVAHMVKRLPAMQETQVRSLGQEDPGNGNTLQYSCLENPTDGGAWQATVHGVTKSQTQLSNLTSPFL